MSGPLAHIASPQSDARVGAASVAKKASNGSDNKIIPRFSQQIVGALALPGPPVRLPEARRPLPIPDLHRLPRDGSMLYGIGRVDASGRVVNHEIVAALGWHPGDGVEAIIAHRAIVMRTSPDGLISVAQRPRIVIPAAIRRLRGIAAGDHVLLAAAPDHGVLIVHTLSDLDDMLADYYSAQSLAS